MALRNWFRSARTTPARLPQPRLGVHQLEAREVPALDLVSAVGLGNDAGSSSASDVAADSAGYSYKTGSFIGTLDFDPAGTRPGDTDILASAGDRDIFVAKYAPDDTLVWAVRMGGAGYDIGKAIDVDGAGNVHVTGSFSGGTAQFGPTSLTSAGHGNDGFVAKVNPAGAVQWAKRWGQTDQPNNPGTGTGDIGRGVDTDTAGNVYVVGSRITNNPPAALTYGYDVLKFTPTGTLVKDWPKAIALNSLGPLYGDLVTDASGNVFVTGNFDGTVDFDPSKASKTMYGGSMSAFVLKLTSAGNFGWVSTFSSGYGQSLARDANGNVFVGGFYHREPSFSQYGGPYSVPTNLPMIAKGGAFIAKLTSSGGLTWAKGLVETSTTTAYIPPPRVFGLAVDAVGSVYATGDFVGTVDLDPGAGTLVRQSALLADGSGPSGDVFVIKLTAAGNLAWAETFGGDGADSANGIAVDPSGLIHLAGGYSGTVDFDPDPVDTYYLTTPTVSRQLFFVKLRQS